MITFVPIIPERYLLNARKIFKSSASRVTNQTRYPRARKRADHLQTHPSSPCKIRRQKMLTSRSRVIHRGRQAFTVHIKHTSLYASSRTSCYKYVNIKRHTRLDHQHRCRSNAALSILIYRWSSYRRGAPLFA